MIQWLSLTGTILFAVGGVLWETRDKESKKLTPWGWLVLVGVVGGGLVSGVKLHSDEIGQLQKSRSQLLEDGRQVLIDFCDSRPPFKTFLDADVEQVKRDFSLLSDDAAAKQAYQQLSQQILVPVEKQMKSICTFQ